MSKTSAFLVVAEEIGGDTNVEIFDARDLSPMPDPLSSATNESFHAALAQAFAVLDVDSPRNLRTVNDVIKEIAESV